jgi:hypothetical protein
MGTGGPFLGGKAWPGRDADHSPPSCAEVKNEQELYLLSPKRLRGVYWDCFSFNRESEKHIKKGLIYPDDDYSQYLNNRQKKKIIFYIV